MMEDQHREIKDLNIAIIGLGLIGGSMGLALKDQQGKGKVYGIDSNELHGSEALKAGLVDEIVDLDAGILKADIIILAVPVDAAENILSKMLEHVTNQVIFDVGSTKSSICRLADSTGKRENFVATHPMWGTEFSGPKAAVRGAFAGKAVVICDKGRSGAAAVLRVEQFYGILGMHILYMDSNEHDVHAAYVSHISHISSFALANTVLEKEKEDGNIFELASGGFESTVRLAKSSIETWVPIFMQNRENVLDVLNEHIAQLRKFKSCLEKENFDYMSELIANANSIKRILK